MRIMTTFPFVSPALPCLLSPPFRSLPSSPSSLLLLSPFLPSLPSLSPSLPPLSPSTPQNHTRTLTHSGVRPFGVSLLIAGFDEDTPFLFQCDPSVSSYIQFQHSSVCTCFDFTELGGCIYAGCYCGQFTLTNQRRLSLSWSPMSPYQTLVILLHLKSLL